MVRDTFTLLPLIKSLEFEAIDLVRCESEFNQLNMDSNTGRKTKDKGHFGHFNTSNFPQPTSLNRSY